jgi:hypothetical protein
VKFDYNEQLEAAKFVRYNQEFIITRVVYVFYMDLGLQKFARYNQEFVITKFVKTEFDCLTPTV